MPKPDHIFDLERRQQVLEEEIRASGPTRRINRPNTCQLYRALAG
jgi:hypothetical protein